MKVLVVDDEELIQDIIKEYCENENYNVLCASNGLEAIDKVKEHNDIDIIILDLMMPKMDGFTAYKEIKNIKNIPTIILSARQEECDKLNGFDLGVDDYITKPFSPKELIARIKAITKRTSPNKNEFIYKNFKIDKIGHAVYINNNEINLTPKEYELLVYLEENKNVALSREQLLNKVWGYDFYGDNRTVDTHIKMLRNSMMEYRNLLKTIRGMGYKFEIK